MCCCSCQSVYSHAHAQSPEFSFSLETIQNHSSLLEEEAVFSGRPGEVCLCRWSEHSLWCPRHFLPEVTSAEIPINLSHLLRQGALCILLPLIMMDWFYLERAHQLWYVGTRHCMMEQGEGHCKRQSITYEDVNKQSMRGLTMGSV